MGKQNMKRIWLKDVETTLRGKTASVVILDDDAQYNDPSGEITPLWTLLLDSDQENPQ